MTFVGNGQTPAQAALHAAQLTFLGPLLGSLTRMGGGRLSDRFGGSRVTFWTFCTMAVTTVALVYTSMLQSRGDGTLSGGALVLFFAAFLTLFALTGMGNASVYTMIPAVFEARSRDLGLGEPERVAWSRAHAGALIGVAGAVGALGGFGINMTLRASYQASGSATTAFVVFAAFYVVAALVTRAVYLRRPDRGATPTGVTPRGMTTTTPTGPTPTGPTPTGPIPTGDTPAGDTPAAVR